MRLLPIVALACAACAPSRSEMLSSVRDDAHARIGATVEWRGETSEDAAVDAAVAKLLAKELTEDGAAQWDPLESTCRHASLSIL